MILVTVCDDLVELSLNVSSGWRACGSRSSYEDKWKEAIKTREVLEDWYETVHSEMSFCVLEKDSREAVVSNKPAIRRQGSRAWVSKWKTKKYV